VGSVREDVVFTDQSRNACQEDGKFSGGVWDLSWIYAVSLCRFGGIFLRLWAGDSRRDVVPTDTPTTTGAVAVRSCGAWFPGKIVLPDLLPSFRGHPLPFFAREPERSLHAFTGSVAQAVSVDVVGVFSASCVGSPFVKSFVIR